MAAKKLELPEDAVEYRLFPLVPPEICSEEGVRAYLEEQLEACVSFLSPFLVDYIWQSEPFHLTSVIAGPSSENVPPHLYGVTNFGDNIEDEWFIVFLLRQLTKELSGLVVQVQDNDGEFLLIEAANTLPKWVNPDTSENRIYLYQGALHVIPYPLTPAHIALLPTSCPTLGEAVNCVRANPSLTMAQAEVQQDIDSRLDGFPEKSQNAHHNAHCYIPASLAAVLEENPSLVAPMVQAFYYRDPLDLKACITFHHFRPGTRVMRRVRFTRCLYAQLLQQRFAPDRRSGYTMPAASNAKFKAYDLGMKLAHGAEILCSKCGTAEAMDDPIKSVTSDPRWHRYKSTLDTKGYFKAELEGSRLYNKLLDDAKRYFIKSLGPNDRLKEADPAQQILRLSKQVQYDIEEMRKDERKLLPADNDKWLEIDPADLDAMLEKAAGKRPAPSNGDDLENMKKGVNAFVNKVSSHEGVEVSRVDDNEIQFDPNSFMQSMQKVFEFDSDGNSSSDLDEYGSDDENDDFENYTPKNKAHGSASRHKPKNGDSSDDYLGISDYMDIMDRELAKTSIGKSFEKYSSDEKATSAPKAPPRRKKQAKKENAYPAAGSTSSSAQSTPVHGGVTGRGAPQARPDDMEDLDDIDDLDDDFQPVNVDLNMVKNLMESYNSQGGLAGPTSNLLGSLGVRIPHDRRGNDDDF